VPGWFIPAPCRGTPSECRPDGKLEHTGLAQASLPAYGSTQPRSFTLSSRRLDAPHRIPAVVPYTLEGSRAFCLTWRRFAFGRPSRRALQLEILFGSRSVFETTMCPAVLRASAGFSLSSFTVLVLRAHGRIRAEPKDSGAGDSAVRVWEGL